MLLSTEVCLVFVLMLFGAAQNTGEYCTIFFVFASRSVVCVCLIMSCFRLIMLPLRLIRLRLSLNQFALGVRLTPLRLRLNPVAFASNPVARH